MDHESVIRLELERQDDCVLVSSPQFPLLHLAIQDTSETQIEQCVLPVLKEMVEFKVGGEVELRLIDAFGSEDDKTDTHLLPPHVIASRAAAHIG